MKRAVDPTGTGSVVIDLLTLQGSSQDAAAQTNAGNFHELEGLPEKGGIPTQSVIEPRPFGKWEITMSTVHRLRSRSLRWFMYLGSLLVVIVGFKTDALGEAIYPFSTPLPNDPTGAIRNTIVRINSLNGLGLSAGVGTGTVFDIVPDAKGNGGVICVLTADHVACPGQSWQVGFGDGTGGDGPWQYTTTVETPGPMMRRP